MANVNMNTALSNKDSKNQILQAFKERAGEAPTLGGEEELPEEAPIEETLEEVGETEQPVEIAEQDSVEATEPEQLEETEETITEEGHPEEDSEEEQPQEVLSGEQLDTVLQSLVTVPIDGQDYTVSVKELTEGYSRQQDYTKNSQSIAEERRTVQEQAGEYTNRLHEVNQHLDMITNLLSTPKYTPAQLNEALADDPDSYIRMKAENDQYAESMLKAKGDMEANKQRIADEANQAFNAQAQQGKAYLEKNMPEVLDEKNQKALGGYLVEMGYTPQEVSSVVDHRAIAIAWKAHMFDKLQKDAKPRRKKAAKVPKVQKRGSAPKTKGQQSDLVMKQKKQTFAKSGKRKDGMELMRTFKQKH